MTTAIPAEAFDHGDHRRYNRGCHCPNCRHAKFANNRLCEYMRSTGRGDLRDPARAIAHIYTLRVAGMTDDEIKAAAGIGDRNMYDILKGTGQVRRETEQKILSVTPPAGRIITSMARVPPAGTRRRLQAAAVAGWPVTVIASRIGRQKQFVCGLQRRPDSQHVALRTHQVVRRLSRDLLGRRPEDHGVPAVFAERARLLALSYGWHPIGVWDDIDDPNEVPQYGDQVSRRQAIIEDTAELVREGLSPEGIAMRLGIDWESVRRAHLRAGVMVPEVAA